MSEFIRLRKLPDEHAQHAYEQGFYIEAIQVLHAWVETQAQSLFMLVGAVHFNAEQREIWAIADSFSFNKCLDALYILNQITKSEYESFKQLNAMRNRIIHKIYHEPYEKIFEGIPRPEYDRVFEETMEQAYFFTRKTEEIIELEPKT